MGNVKKKHKAGLSPLKKHAETLHQSILSSRCFPRPQHVCLER